MSQEALIAMLDDVARRAPARRRIEYVPASRVVTVLRPGVMVVRVMGSGGSGGGSSAAGNGGTVGIKTVRVAKGNTYTITIPSAASGSPYSGADGGTLTVVGPGASISVPGGRGGKQGANGQNVAPSGLDVFWLGQEANSSWGGDAPRFWGVTAEIMARAVGASTASDAPPDVHIPEHSCALLFPRASVRYSAFGRGGNANGGGHGGPGGGGGAGYPSSHGSPIAGGNGGLAWVTLEFLEDDHV